MPKLSTSLLNESVTIQTLSGSSVDDRGLSTSTYSDSATNVQARIMDSGGVSEVDADGRTEQVVEFRIYVHANTTVSMDDRVSYDGRFYNIKNIKNIKDRFGNVFYKELIMDSGY
jgi:SPP1 family predicted phage head-tail adaptor|tara:strand:- start:278 stop:622 length:345 start_codon:yes stop_codon:yes gene_type:complete